MAPSPDGQRVAYVVREALLTEETSEFLGHLYLASADGEAIQLTFGEHHNASLRWSPDGTYLAFLSKRSGKANVFVMRASGGEAWAITQTHRFQAAGVGAGVTNLASFNGTSDISSFIPDYLGAEFWDDLEPYRRHSAIFNVKGVKTPTLILHGEQDVRVPLGQGRELFNALKRQGVPVELVIYPRQGHVVDEPRLLIDLNRRTAAWLGRWIRGEEGQGEVPDPAQ